MGLDERAVVGLEFDFPDPYSSNVDRDWEIKVAQIPCGANYR